MSKLLRLLILVYVSPNTLAGLAIGLIGVASGGKAQRRDGCIEFHGGFVEWFLKNIPPGSKRAGMAAMTLGHAIIGQNPQMLDTAREHEHVHVRQYEIWGPLFVPAYVSFSFLLWLGRRDPYLENPFEIEAYGKVDHQKN